MKGLKTYFTYLHRNKLFTLVNVAGLGISLMFVLLIANMVVRQLTVGSDIKDIEHIYVLSNEEYSASNYLVGERLANRYPEMADWCAVNAEACNSGSYAVIENRKTSLEILRRISATFVFNAACCRVGLTFSAIRNTSSARS